MSSRKLREKMKPVQLILVLATLLISSCTFSSNGQNSFSVRICAYNVECGEGGKNVLGNTAEDFGRLLKEYNFDIIAFNEVPDGDWTNRVGKIVGLKYSYVGKISSANHKNKYKSILSRYPLEGKSEYKLKGEKGWNPSSAVRAVAKVNDVNIAIYSLHVSSQNNRNVKSHLSYLVTEYLPKENCENVLVVGDFNNKVSDKQFTKLEAAGFKTSWSDLNIDVSKLSTFPSRAFKHKNIGVIDHIFIKKSPKVKATDGGILEETKKPLSDHKAVWTEIAYPTKLKKMGRSK